MPTHRVSLHSPEADVISEAAAHLRAGRLVAFPTETVYGLGANALDAAAVARIYEAKGRPAFNPLIVHLAAAGDVHKVASAWPPAAAALAEAFWPGPLTLVVPRLADVPDTVSAGLPSVAVRVPAHPVAHALLVAAEIPVAAPSANRSTELSPTLAQHVERALGDRIAMILDAGPTMVGIESTVVDVTGERPVLLRPGGLTRRAIEAVAGAVDVSPATPGDSTPRPSPGLMDRHYAPAARVMLFDRSTDSAAMEEILRVHRRGGRTGALTWSGHVPAVRETCDVSLELLPDPGGYARHLYAALHELDEQQCELVVVERPPAGEEWEGVRDRLRRAAVP